MVLLRVVLAELQGSPSAELRRYLREISRALVAAAPEGCGVEALVGALTRDELTALEVELPGLERIRRSPLAPRELEATWRRGLPGSRIDGLLHAPTLLAPYRSHDRGKDLSQLSVTIHDAIPWTHPRFLPASEEARLRAAAKRARRHADAIVVPTHAVAQQLGEHLGVEDRIRVIGAAPSPTLAVPTDADARAEVLGLPGTYALASASASPSKALDRLAAAIADPALIDLPLVLVAGDVGDRTRAAAIVREAGLDERRLMILEDLSDPDLAVAVSRASVVVVPSLAEGFGLALVNAFALGAPVVHSDDPALVEVAGGAGLVVPREAKADYTERLGIAIEKVLTDRELAATLRVTGADRARAFSWRDSATRLWQLHADL